LLFPDSYIILYWEFYFLPFSVHAQTNVIYLTFIVSIIVGFLILHKFLYWLISSNFLFHCDVLGLRFFCTISCQIYSIAVFVSVQVSDAYVNVLSIIVFFPRPWNKLIQPNDLPLLQTNDKGCSKGSWIVRAIPDQNCVGHMIISMAS
jgi:hypothetical protein